MTLRSCLPACSRACRFHWSHRRVTQGRNTTLASTSVLFVSTPNNSAFRRSVSLVLHEPLSLTAPLAQRRRLVGHRLLNASRLPTTAVSTSGTFHTCLGRDVSSSPSGRLKRSGMMPPDRAECCTSTNAHLPRRDQDTRCGVPTYRNVPRPAHARGGDRRIDGLFPLCLTMSLTITPSERRSCLACCSTFRISVVFPAPRNPDSSVTFITAASPCLPTPAAATATVPSTSTLSSLVLVVPPSPLDTGVGASPNLTDARDDMDIAHPEATERRAS